MISTLNERLTGGFRLDESTLGEWSQTVRTQVVTGGPQTGEFVLEDGVGSSEQADVCGAVVRDVALPVDWVPLVLPGEGGIAVGLRRGRRRGRLCRRD